MSKVMGAIIPNRRNFDDIRIMSNDLVMSVREYRDLLTTTRGELRASLDDDARNSLDALCNAMRIMQHHAEAAQRAIEVYHKTHYHAN